MVAAMCFPFANQLLILTLNIYQDNNLFLHSDASVGFTKKITSHGLRREKLQEPDTSQRHNQPFPYEMDE